MINKMNLVNGVERNAEYPETFYIPLMREKEAIKAGDYAQLGFICDEGSDCATERMWVLVTECRFPAFEGTLANEPIHINLKYGAMVDFDQENVIGILTKQ